MIQDCIQADSHDADLTRLHALLKRAEPLLVGSHPHYAVFTECLTKRLAMVQIALTDTQGEDTDLQDQFEQLDSLINRFN